MLKVLVGILIVAGVNGQAGIKWRGFKSGTTSNVVTESTFVLNSEAEFQTYWQRQLGLLAQAAPRDVKWGEEMLVAVHLGRSNTLGYTCFVQKVERTAANTITITYSERKPAPGSFNGQMISSPYEIIRMDRAGGNYLFKKTESTAPGGGGTVGNRWRVLSTGSDSLITTTRQLLINNGREWAEYWRTHAGPRETPPRIDFTQEWIVAVHGGRRATSGHDILITSVDQLPNGAVGISYTDRQPATGQIVENKATFPFSIVRIAPFTGEIFFERRVWDNSGY